MSVALWPIWLAVVFGVALSWIGRPLILGHSVDWSTVALSAGVTAAVFVLVLAALVLALMCHEYVNDRLLQRMGPLLTVWVGAEVSDDDLRDWRRARRAGITVAEAQRWSDHGLPFPLATKARKLGIDLPTVVGLAGALRDAGLWDGSTRRDVQRWLGADHRPEVGLNRWARFTPAQIRAGIRNTLGPPGAPELSEARSVRKVLTALGSDHDDER